MDLIKGLIVIACFCVSLFVTGKFEGERLVVASPALSLEGGVKSAGNKT